VQSAYAENPVVRLLGNTALAASVFRPVRYMGERHRAVRDFVIWGSPPAGHIDSDKAQWLMTALNVSLPKTARTITREIVREGPAFDDDLRAVAASSQPNACKKQHSAKIS